MAFFKSLIKDHGKRYFEPIGHALATAGIRQPNMANPAHAWALRNALVPYAGWWIGEHAALLSGAPTLDLPAPFRNHAKFAASALRSSRLEISGVMRKHQLRLADRQCRMAELSQRLQDLIVILTTSCWGAKQSNETVRAAADVLCTDLRRKLSGSRPDDASLKAVTKLGASIADGGFEAIAGIDAESILMPYKNDPAPAH
jgi:acyl-CoA dehydrogenase